MAQHPSPGVYSKIIDLSDYVQTYPSTVGFIPIICEQGEDNKLIDTNSRDFYIDFGEPNINYATKVFGQGPYVASAFFRESDSLKIIRCLPSDAAFSNLVITAEPTASVGADTTSDIATTSLSAQNTTNEMDTSLETNENVVIFYGVGRGEYYNNFKISITKHANPQLSDAQYVGSNDFVYVLDIYKKQTEKDESGADQYEIISSFDVSFNLNAVDTSGESLWIEDVLNRYSRYIKCIADSTKCLTAIENDADFSQPFTSAVALTNGTSGTLFDTDNVINSTVATQILTKAYNGTLEKKSVDDQSSTLYVDEVLDTDNQHFTVVFDGGYPTSVKTSGIYTLVQSRKDCIAFIDNGDTVSTDRAVNNRDNNHTFNTKYMALYEPYSKVYDAFTGKDLWLTPVYHMAAIVPFTDNIGQIWDAPAGFNRATIANIKELRYSPNQTQRDTLYLKQINPIVKFNVGLTVFSQLTTQKRPTALQDINVVRLLLYIQKALSQYCKFYIFELNDSVTWDAISEDVTKFLKVIQNKRGLYSFSVDVGANEYEIKAKRIHVNITLEPTKVVEQIHLNYFIK